jgi:hypothetical protein
VQGGRGGPRGAPLTPPLLRHGGRTDASMRGRSPPPPQRRLGSEGEEDATADDGDGVGVGAR